MSYSSIILRLSKGVDKNFYRDDVAESTRHFERCYYRRLPIVISLSISSDWHFLRVTEAASKKVRVHQQQTTFNSIASHVFFRAMYRGNGESQVADGPFPEIILKLQLRTSYCLRSFIKLRTKINEIIMIVVKQFCILLSRMHFRRIVNVSPKKKAPEPDWKMNFYLL